jgi:hypothetical protein
MLDAARNEIEMRRALRNAAGDLFPKDGVNLPLLRFGRTSIATNDALIDVSRSTASSKNGAARCSNGFDSRDSRHVCSA